MKPKKYVLKGQRSSHSLQGSNPEDCEVQRIRFDLTPEKLACFIDGENSSVQKTRQTFSEAKKRTRLYFSSSQTGQMSKKKSKPIESQDRQQQARLFEDDQLVKCATREVLTGIQKDGIAFQWDKCEPQTCLEDGDFENGDWTYKPEKHNEETFSKEKQAQTIIYHKKYVSETSRPCTRWKTYDQCFIDARFILHDQRTTLMIKNIPYSSFLNDLLATFDSEFFGLFDFLYLPIASNGSGHLGYAFINLLTLTSVQAFYQRFHCKYWNGDPNALPCVLKYSRIQGVRNFIQNVISDRRKHAKPAQMICRDNSYMSLMLQAQYQYYY